MSVARTRAFTQTCLLVNTNDVCVEMSVARTRAFTHPCRNPCRYRKCTVEMSVARTRAFTHFGIPITLFAS